ncbi:MAG: phosphatase PAP2 family protein [Proteobacteria bacterium]|nr:phosphatase PAP2 family protein [Pseudomonadota bacterium]
METRFLLWLHEHSTPALDLFFRISHEFGTEIFGVGIVTAAAIWWAIRRDRKEVLLWILLGLSTLFLQAGLKIAFGRPRPELWMGPIHHTSFAFPSGHALSSATFFALTARGMIKLWPHLKIPAVILAVVMPLYVGFGRLYLGVHWPSDVLAGWVLGGMQTWLAIRLFDHYWPKQK